MATADAKKETNASNLLTIQPPPPKQARFDIDVDPGIFIIFGEDTELDGIMRAGVTPLLPGGRPLPPPLVPPAVGSPVATGARSFKVWLDNLFLAKNIEGKLVEDHRGRRFYGLFDHMRCPEANKFMQDIAGYDWSPAAQYNAGTSLVAMKERWPSLCVSMAT